MVGGDGSGLGSDSEGIDIEIRNDSGSTYTVDLLIENNSLTTTNNGSREVLFVESKGDATVNVTIRNNSPLSHTGTATGNIIEVEAEDALSTVNASISGKVMDIKYSHFKTPSPMAKRVGPYTNFFPEVQRLAENYERAPFPETNGFSVIEGLSFFRLFACLFTRT